MIDKIQAVHTCQRCLAICLIVAAIIGGVCGPGLAQRPPPAQSSLRKPELILNQYLTDSRPGKLSKIEQPSAPAFGNVAGIASVPGLRYRWEREKLEGNAEMITLIAVGEPRVILPTKATARISPSPVDRARKAIYQSTDVRNTPEAIDEEEEKCEERAEAERDDRRPTRAVPIVPPKKSTGHSVRFTDNETTPDEAVNARLTDEESLTETVESAREELVDEELVGESESAEVTSIDKPTTDDKSARVSNACDCTNGDGSEIDEKKMPTENDDPGPPTPSTLEQSINSPRQLVPDLVVPDLASDVEEPLEPKLIDEIIDTLPVKPMQETKEANVRTIDRWIRILGFRPFKKLATLSLFDRW